jgi:large subunit ribosomal protein L29
MAVEIAKLREMSLEELGTEESNLRQAVWKLRIQQNTGQLQDPNRVRQARRDLARVLTIKRERELSRAGS